MANVYPMGVYCKASETKAYQRGPTLATRFHRAYDRIFHFWRNEFHDGNSVTGVSHVTHVSYIISVVRT